MSWQIFCRGQNATYRLSVLLSYGFSEHKAADFELVLRQCDRLQILEVEVRWSEYGIVERILAKMITDHTFLPALKSLSLRNLAFPYLPTELALPIGLATIRPHLDIRAIGLELSVFPESY